MDCHEPEQLQWQETDLSSLRFQDLFNVEEIQRIQDAFSLATGVASLITSPDGVPITRPSNFTNFCNMVRKSSIGRQRCIDSDVQFSLYIPVGPVLGLCSSGRLLDGGTAIAVGDRQIACWMIGQVRDETTDYSELAAFAGEIGIDPAELLQALEEVPRMSRDRFEKICQSLYLITGQLSALALRNVQQRQYIEARQKIETELRESEERYRILWQKSSEAIVLIDLASRKVIESNPRFQQLLGYSQAELDEMPIYPFIVDEPSAIDRYYDVVLPQQHELTLELRSFRHKDGRIVEVERSGALVHIKGKPFFMVTARDVTERKYIEAKMNYLSYHDVLTGLYNRNYFEQELSRIDKITEAPIGLIIFDLDGLKLVNDSFGHEQGDNLLVRTAELILSCFRESDIVARIGGDEISVVMENSSGELLEQALMRVYGKVEELQKDTQRIPISLSAGYAFRNDNRTSMREVFREADNKMYRAKLHRSQSARSAIVHTVMSLLEARDFITEGHADRLQDMLIGLARAIGLPESRMTDLRLLAQFHDIGKVGIPDRILLKPGLLDPDEVIEMRRHCEIGHRIAQSSPDLLPVADWVLKHQEWWNGKGYPLGLAGEQIPIECRILAIADAYDAMTSDRPYRKAMGHAKAVDELRRCSGSQFDPALVELFIESRQSRQ